MEEPSPGQSEDVTSKSIIRSFKVSFSLREGETLVYLTSLFSQMKWLGAMLRMADLVKLLLLYR